MAVKFLDGLLNAGKSLLGGFVKDIAFKGLSKLSEWISPKAKQFLDSGIGKVAQKLVPNLAKTVEDFLNPAKLFGMFGGSKNPGDFANVLGAGLQNVPFLGGLFR